MPTEYPLNAINFSSTPTFKKIFFNELDESGCNVKYRNIPVMKTSDNLETPGVHCENLSGVKEVKNLIGIRRSSNRCSSPHSIFNSKSLTGTPIQLSKLDAGMPINTSHRKLNPQHDFFCRIGQGSVSEPALAVAKDRGDNITLRDAYMKSSFLSSKYFGGGKRIPPKERGVQGHIYIKKSGKVYKLKIETKAVKIEKNDTYCNTKKGQPQKIPRLADYISKNKISDPAAITGRSSFKLGSEDDDFEIAIFLSGLKNISRTKTQDTVFSKTKRMDARKSKMKKRNFRRHRGKNFEMLDQSYQSSPKLLKINSRDTDFSNLTCKVTTSHSNFDFLSSDSFGNESENEKFLKRQPGRALGNLSFATTYKSRKNGPPSHRSLMSESSISPYGGDMNGAHKKLLDEKLWEKFEVLFRNYACTSRHSGEVIPKKISTEWMVNVGVVDEYLTEKEADEAFKNAAGAKITMNTLEYKEFLIMLSLRMKLPFYEIYRRMCGM